MTLNFCKNIIKKSNNKLENKRPEGCDGSMLMPTKSMYSSMCVSLNVAWRSEGGEAEVHAVLKGLCLCVYCLHHYSAFMPKWAGVSQVTACALAVVECNAAPFCIISSNEGGWLLWMEAAATELLCYWCDGVSRGRKGRCWHMRVEGWSRK